MPVWACLVCSTCLRTGSRAASVMQKGWPMASAARTNCNAILRGWGAGR